MARQKGFSVFEILAAMAIAAMVMVITAPPMAKMLDKITFRKDVHDVMAQVRGWKLMAVSKGKPVTITLEDDVLIACRGNGDKEEKPVKQGITLTMDPDRIQFSPEGWATPATIEITGKKRSRKVEINPLTGQPQKI